MKKINSLLFAVFFFAGTASATSIEIGDFDIGSTLLNFDGLSHGTVLDDEYSSFGITISGTLGNDATGAASLVTVNATGGANSLPNYIGQPNYSWDGSIIFDFSGVITTQFGGVLASSASDWLSVYDTNNNLIETVFGNGSIQDFVGIDTGSVNISKAVFSGDFYAVDDVIFNSTAPVPEPSTILLFGAGLASLVGFRKRKK